MASISGISVDGTLVHVPISDSAVFFVLRIVSRSSVPDTAQVTRRLASCPGLLFLSILQVAQQSRDCRLDSLQDWIVDGRLGEWMNSAQ